MTFTEEQIKNMMQLREYIEKKLEKNKEETKMLENNLEMINIIFRDASFTKASDLRIEKNKKEIEYSIPIIDNNRNVDIANATITDDQISIVLEKDVHIKEDTPPFKSFFINRIITEMKKKDMDDIKNHIMTENDVIEYDIRCENEIIKSIIINKYRKKERINEILNTIGWSISRMIENSK